MSTSRYNNFVSLGLSHSRGVKGTQPSKWAYYTRLFHGGDMSPQRNICTYIAFTSALIGLDNEAETINATKSGQTIGSPQGIQVSHGISVVNRYMKLQGKAIVRRTNRVHPSKIANQPRKAGKKPNIKHSITWQRRDFVHPVLVC